MKRTNEKTSHAGPEEGDYAGPRSPLRVMQIVEALAGMPGGMPLTQLSEHLGIPKTSLLSHLRVLLGSGHVAMDETRYLLGGASLRLGLVIAASATVAAAARPIVAELAHDTGETGMLAMLDPVAAQAVYVERANGTNPIRFAPDVGARRPLYCTAFGRALLAFQDDDFIKRYLEQHALERVTQYTVTSARAVQKDLQELRTTGVATSLQAHTLEAGAIAAPVFEQQGPVRYAIGIALPVSRAGSRQKRLEERVRDAARKLTWTLGAPWPPAS